MPHSCKMRRPAFCPSAPCSQIPFNSSLCVSSRSYRALNKFASSNLNPSTASPRRTKTTCLHDVSPSTTKSSPIKPLDYVVKEWNFNGFTLQYATTSPTNASEDLPILILVHGFGANCKHWRRNLAPLANKNFRVFAPDLLGFGMGDKPLPGVLDSQGRTVEYSFDYWTQQLYQFITDVVHPKRPLYFVANSIGAMVTMQLSVQHPSLCAANVFISPSLRMLNVRKRNWVQGLTAPLLIQLLAYRPLGSFFLQSLATPKQLSNVLMEAYTVHEAIDEELIDIIARPAFSEGALDVFLAFISYDGGPIPEDFLPLLSQPSMVIWGVQDRFEPYELGQALRHYATVQQFVPLEGVGHCAHDEKPEEVNQLISDFIHKQLEKGAGTKGA